MLSELFVLVLVALGLMVVAAGIIGAYVGMGIIWVILFIYDKLSGWRRTRIPAPKDRSD